MNTYAAYKKSVMMHRGAPTSVHFQIVVVTVITLEWMRNSGEVEHILHETPRTASELRAALKARFGGRDSHMDRCVSSTRNMDAQRLRVPHLMAFYMEAREYLSEQDVSYKKGLPLQELLSLLRIITCPHLLRNHVFLVLDRLGLLAPEVREQISALKAQGTNSTEFKRKFGPMPETRDLLKNMRNR